jgi:hypothetical protein
MWQYSHQFSEEGNWEGSDNSKESHLEEWGTRRSWSWSCSVPWCGSVAWCASVSSGVSCGNTHSRGHNLSWDEGSVGSNIVSPVVSCEIRKLATRGCGSQVHSEDLDRVLVTAGSSEVGAVSGDIASRNSQVGWWQCGASNRPVAISDAPVSLDWLWCADLVNGSDGSSIYSANLGAASVRRGTIA